MSELREAAQADPLVKELLDESDLCAAEGADEIASLLYRAAKKIAHPPRDEWRLASECSSLCHPDEPRCVITEDGKCDAGNKP